MGHGKVPKQPPMRKTSTETLGEDDDINNDTPPLPPPHSNSNSILGILLQANRRRWRKRGRKRNGVGQFDENPNEEDDSSSPFSSLDDETKSIKNWIYTGCVADVPVHEHHNRKEEKGTEHPGGNDDDDDTVLI
jgi:hypothetical protein